MGSPYLYPVKLESVGASTTVGKPKYVRLDAEPVHRADRPPAVLVGPLRAARSGGGSCTTLCGSTEIQWSHTVTPLAHRPATDVTC